MPVLKTITFGCKVNQYETELVRQAFERLGYRNAGNGEPADLCIVNSCAVTAESGAKSRKTIRRLAKTYPQAEIIVMGCYAACAAGELAALPGVTDVIADKRNLRLLFQRRGLVAVPDGITHFDGRRRALVKVQDGCRMRCTYCIVPRVRPHLVSRPSDEVLEEARRLIAYGHREIVLTGVHLGDYGHDGFSLARLVRRMVELDGEFRVRLSSIEAGEVTPELIGLMAGHSDRICPHLHIPLQSGSDAVLERMNRRRPVQWFVDRCREIRGQLDQPALTTDVIVGFPGETEADFAATCRVVEEVGFAKAHIFRFSPRQGTPAATMPRQVTNRIAQRRATELGELAQTVGRKYLEGLVGRRLQVIVERAAPGGEGWMVGTSERHIAVVVRGGRELIGQFKSVVAERVGSDRIWAKDITSLPSLPNFPA